MRNNQKKPRWNQGEHFENKRPALGNYSFLAGEQKRPLETSRTSCSRSKFPLGAAQARRGAFWDIYKDFNMLNDVTSLPGS